jgi:integrase
MSKPRLSLVEENPKQFQKIDGHLYRNTKTGIIYVIKTFKRYRIPRLFKSTSEERIGKARGIADKFLDEHRQRYLGLQSSSGSPRGNSRQIREVIDELLKTVTPTKRVGTQENHKIYLGILKKEWGSFDVNRINLALWNDWLTEFRSRSSRQTFGDFTKHMNLVLRYAYTHKYASHLLTLPNPDKPSKTGRVYTEEEIDALYEAMNEETKDQYVLCFECFMRLREALYLTWDRVDFKEGTIALGAEHVKTGSKTGKGRTFKMSDLAIERLSKRPRTSRFVFPSADPERPVHSNKKAWITAKRKVGIKGRARWHDLRHTALTWALLDQRRDPVLVSEYAGVSLRTIQRVYLHSTAEKTASVAGAVSVFAKKGSIKDQSGDKK